MDALCVAALCVFIGLLALLLLAPARNGQKQPPVAAPLNDADWADADDEREPVYYHRAWMAHQRDGDDAGPVG